MSSDQYRPNQHASTCTAKRLYSTRGMADRAIKRWRRRKTFRKVTGYHLSAYLCEHCRAWHIGKLEARGRGEIDGE